MKTEAEYRQMAKDARRRSQESWERSDTDGFMSQGAADTMAMVYDAQADIARDGGKHVFQGLYEGDTRLRARIVAVPGFGYGTDYMWVLQDAADIERFGRKWIPVGDRSRVQKQLGLCQRQEWDFADAKCGGWGSVQVYRTKGLDGENAELIREQI